MERKKQHRAPEELTVPADPMPAGGRIPQIVPDRLVSLYLEAMAFTTMEDIVEQNKDGRWVMRKNIPKGAWKAVRSVKVDANGCVREVQLESKLGAIRTFLDVHGKMRRHTAADDQRSLKIDLTGAVDEQDAEGTAGEQGGADGDG